MIESNGKDAHRKCLSNLAYLLIGDLIFNSVQVVERLHKGLKTWLDTERRTRSVHPHRATVPALVIHLVRHHQYSTLEKHYVDLTQSFYIKESAGKAEELKDDPKAFFKHARVRIDEESARVRAVLPVTAWSIVGTTTEQSLWAGRTEWIANKSTPSYLLCSVGIRSFYQLCRATWIKETSIRWARCILYFLESTPQRHCAIHLELIFE